MARKKKPDKEPSLTGNPDLDGIAGAMVLLLSELPAEHQVTVMRAVASKEIIVSLGSLNVNHTVGAMHHRITSLEGYFDGSSGLGRIAVEGAQREVKELRLLHALLAGYLNA